MSERVISGYRTINQIRRGRYDLDVIENDRQELFTVAAKSAWSEENTLAEFLGHRIGEAARVPVPRARLVLSQGTFRFLTQFISPNQCVLPLSDALLDRSQDQILRQVVRILCFDVWTSNPSRTTENIICTKEAPSEDLVAMMVDQRVLPSRITSRMISDDWKSLFRALIVTRQEAKIRDLAQEEATSIASSTSKLHIRQIVHEARMITVTQSYYEDLAAGLTQRLAELPKLMRDIGDSSQI